MIRKKKKTPKPESETNTEPCKPCVSTVSTHPGVISVQVRAMRQICADLEAVHSMGGEPCDLVPEKGYAGSGPPSPAGNLCRITARANYLIAALNCEGIGESGSSTESKCCEKAADAYCAAFNACPD